MYFTVKLWRGPLKLTRLNWIRYRSSLNGTVSTASPSCCTVKVPDRSFLDLVFDLDYETSASNNLDKLVRPFALSPKHLQTWCRKQAMLYVKRYGITMLELRKIANLTVSYASSPIPSVKCFVPKLKSIYVNACKIHVKP